MRGLFYAALAVTILASSNTVAAATGDSVQTAKLVPETPTIHESSTRFLRLGEPVDDDLFATEERAKTSELSKLAKQLKLRRVDTKKLAVVAKAKEKLKKLPVLTVSENKFLGLFKQGLSPEKAKALGKIKGDEFKDYKKFHWAAKLAKERYPAAFGRWGAKRA